MVFSKKRFIFIEFRVKHELGFFFLLNIFNQQNLTFLKFYTFQKVLTNEFIEQLRRVIRASLVIGMNNDEYISKSQLLCFFTAIITGISHLSYPSLNWDFFLILDLEGGHFSLRGVEMVDRLKTLAG